MVQDALDTVCGDVKGCLSLSFVDLSTWMVLVSNSATPESQDTLNALCAEAALLLETGHVAMASHAEHIHLFMRSSTDPSDALCCICAHNAAFDKLVPSVQACLSQISGGAS